MKMNSVPPAKIPSDLIERYTQNYKIPVYDMYFNDSVSESLNWTRELIQKFINRYTPNNIYSNVEVSLPYPEGEPYPKGALLNLVAMQKYPIKDKKIAVVGSLLPWLEAIIINMGSKSVTTIEYNKPQSTDLIETMTYDDFVKSEEKYDAIFSYSSIEHSGLGRYGDPLNPEGDIEAMTHIRTHLIENGLAFLGFPVGRDALVWNAHRIYGEHRLPLVFSGFRELEWIGIDKSYIYKCQPSNGGPQPVIVLEKI